MYFGPRSWREAQTNLSWTDQISGWSLVVRKPATGIWEARNGEGVCEMERGSARAGPTTGRYPTLKCLHTAQHRITTGRGDDEIWRLMGLMRLGDKAMSA